MTDEAIEIARAGRPCPLCGEEVLATFWEGRGGRTSTKIEIHHVRDVALWAAGQRPRLCHQIIQTDVL